MPAGATPAEDVPLQGPDSGHSSLRREANQSVPERANGRSVPVAAKEEAYTKALIRSDAASVQIYLQVDTSTHKRRNSSKQPLKQGTS